MRILLDHDIPRQLRRLLAGHQVDTAGEMGWNEMRNGRLLDHAEEEGYEAVITADQKMPYQQNIGGRRMGLIVLNTTRRQLIEARAGMVRRALETLEPGKIIEVSIFQSR